jgi:DNA replication protein
MNTTLLLKWLREGNITIPGALLSQYKELKLNEYELVFLLHVISYLEKGNEFPTPEEISSTMTIQVTDCTAIMHKLIQRGFIDIVDGYSNDGIRYEKYSLDPLWDKLVNHYATQEKRRETETVKQEETNLYSVFEQEFGRPLSPFECESLSMWVDDDHHDPTIIKAALREAVISGKLNFRYIDRILFEWKKNGIKTIEQAKNYGRRFRQSQKTVQKKDTEPAQKSLPFYNWLEQ